MSVNYKAYLLIGYEIDQSDYNKYQDNEKAEPYLLSSNYYYEANKCYFGKIISEVDAGYGVTINISANSYENVCKELFATKSKIDGITPTSMPFPEVYLICAIH